MYNVRHLSGTELRGYITGVAKSQNCIKKGLAKIKSRLKLPSAATIMPTPKAKATVISNRTGTHRNSQVNETWYQNIMPMRMANAIMKSKIATTTAAIGNTSRGTAIFFRTDELMATLGPQKFIALLKKDHGTKAL
jgi:hypothetical protein